MTDPILTGLDAQYIDYSSARLEYPRCLGRGCPARRRTGPDFYCSVDCLPADQRRAHFEGIAVASNTA